MNKEYDLEKRTFEFARRVRKFVKNLPKTLINFDDVKQVLRSSGSIGANYIEANESLGKKDFVLHIKIAKKEAKETRYWLLLMDVEEPEELKREAEYLIQEATELMNILGSIQRKSE